MFEESSVGISAAIEDEDCGSNSGFRPDVVVFNGPSSGSALPSLPSKAHDKSFMVRTR
jgi:hypothetical protein